MNIHSSLGGNPYARKVIVGVPVAALRWDEAIAVLQDRLRKNFFTRVGFLNAHISNIACADEDVMTALRDFLVLPDGLGVDIAAKILYAQPFPDNLNGTDFVPAFLKAIPESLVVGLIGATRKNVEGAAAALARLAPQHAIHVVSDGFFSVLDEPDILERLKVLRPDVLLVALGAPKQEMFIAKKLSERHATMPFAVGALFDFLSESIPRAPNWVRTIRMEWLFRLVIEPGRLWRRYLLGNPVFLLHVLGQKLFGAWSKP